MHDRDRLRQIRVLGERLERLPASVERDWMLGEVRRRAVDIESGTRAMPLRPLVTEPEPFAEPAAPKRAASPSRPKAVVTARPLPDRPRVHAPAPVSGGTPLPEGLVLSLEDDGAVVPEPTEFVRGPAPWARGLRG